VGPPESTGDIEAQASGPQTNGWYTDTVAVTISGAPDISYSLDGAPFTAGTSLVVNGTGVHSLDFQGSDGSHGSLAVPIDVSNPTVTVNATYGFGSVAHASCADSGSAQPAAGDPTRGRRGLYSPGARGQRRCGRGNGRASARPSARA
jgi:hypothetical protein